MLFILIIIDLSSSYKYRKQLELANQRAKDEAEAKQATASNTKYGEINETALLTAYRHTEGSHADARVEIERGDLGGLVLQGIEPMLVADEHLQRCQDRQRRT